MWDFDGVPSTYYLMLCFILLCLLQLCPKDVPLRIDIYDEVGIGGGASGVAGGLLHPYSPKGSNNLVSYFASLANVGLWMWLTP